MHAAYTCVYIIKCIIVVLSLFFVVVVWYVLSNEERSSHSHWLNSCFWLLTNCLRPLASTIDVYHEEDCEAEMRKLTLLTVLMT